MASMNIASLGLGSTGASALRDSDEKRAEERVKAARLARGVETPEQMEKKVREVAEDFVSVFMNQVMKSMRSTVHETKEMHGDNGEKFFQEMLDTEQAKTLAKGKGYGLTELVYQSLLSRYQVTSAGDAAVPVTPAGSPADTPAAGEAATEVDNG